MQSQRKAPGEIGERLCAHHISKSKRLIKKGGARTLTQPLFSLSLTLNHRVKFKLQNTKWIPTDLFSMTKRAV